MFNYKSNFTIICTVFIIQLGICVISTDSYVLSQPEFRRLKPRGLQISIPDEPGLQFFAFHGNVNEEIKPTELGEIFGEVHRAKNDRWTIKNMTVNLRVGDNVNYWIYVQASGVAYKKENQIWTVVAETEVLSTTTEKIEIGNTSLLFEDNFDSFNKTIWKREIKIPLAPDYEFCVYHNENHESLVQTQNGMVRIKPLILEDYYGENATVYGKLQLGGCTSDLPMECTRQAASYNILPPVISARFTTRQSFSFQYGKIEIRAKFPEGDWLYPEMWLEPKDESYGPAYASGRILLGLSRGNENLINTANRVNFDSKKLDFGLRVGSSTNISEYIVSKVHERGKKWTKAFHVYTTIWNTDGFRFLVDEQEVGRLIPGENGWLQNKINSDGKIVAPFDEEFFITFGVGVGGVRVFPDETTSSGHAKPWRNVGAKAMLKFWHARNQWLSSWRRENGKNTAFEIDYVRVWSV